MKWFKHISDSLDDPLIFDLMEEFGHTGYVAFFGTLEVYAREFQPTFGWSLTISLRFLCQKLAIYQRKKLEKILNFLDRSGKWVVKIEGKKATIHIPKFYKFLDESTLKKLRSKQNPPEDLRKDSGKDPEQIQARDVDVDADVDIKKEYCHFGEIAALYNDTLCPPLSKVRTTKAGSIMSDTIKTRLKARWDSHIDYQSVEFWRGLFDDIKANRPFLLGENKRRWQATLAWIVKRENFEKIMDGDYIRRGNGLPATTKGQRARRLIEEMTRGQEGSDSSDRDPGSSLPGGEGPGYDSDSGGGLV